MVAVAAAALGVAGSSVDLSAEWAFPSDWFRAASAFTVVWEVFEAMGFALLAIGFLSAALPMQRRLLTLGARLFVGAGLAEMAAALFRIADLPGQEPWKFVAAEAATAAAGFALAIAAAIAARAFSLRRDTRLAKAAVSLAFAYLMACASYAFFLAGDLDASSNFSPVPWRITWGIGLVAAGRFVLAIGTVVAAVALTKGVRRRAGMLGVGALVVGGGYVVEAVGLMLLARADSRTSAWLLSVSEFLLAPAAVIAGEAFIASRGRSEHGDGADLAVVPDPA